MLKPDEAVEICQELLAMRRADSEPLELLRSYWLGTQDLPVVPTAVPSEVKRMAEMSRINVCSLVVNVPAQAMTVVGIRDESTPDVADAVWEAWQANKMDAHQAPVHRSVLGYGTSYVRVLPGRPYPVMRGRSPRQVTTAYGSDPDWPEYALECVDARGAGGGARTRPTAPTPVPDSRRAAFPLRRGTRSPKASPPRPAAPRA